jgi:hypothetical protein
VWLVARVVVRKAFDYDLDDWKSVHFLQEQGDPDTGYPD